MSEVQVDLNSKIQMEVLVEEEKFTLLFALGSNVDKALEACSRFHLALLKLKEKKQEKDDDCNEETSEV
jgi:hypothetical protein